MESVIPGVKLTIQDLNKIQRKKLDVIARLRKSKPLKRIISSDEYVPLKDLRFNILLAEKGNATVVMNRVDYDHITRMKW